MKPEEFEVYVIPPNFMEGGTLFGGLLKTRNTIEAVILGLAVGVPILHLPFSLTVRVVILCLTALPLVLLALIGVSGMSLSAFIRLFFCFLHNRRILSRDGTQGGKNGKTLLPSWAQQRKSDCEAEDPPLPKSRSRFSVDLKQRSVTQFKTFLQEEEAVQPLNALADYIPIEKIEHGVIYTRDHRYVKVVEVVPVNFLLRSAREQRSIIYSFISYLKIAPVKVQFKALTKRADINRHLDTVRRELEHEQDPRCRVLQEDYLKLIRQLGSREAITRRFFLVFEYEPLPGTKRGHEEEDAIASLQTAARTAANYLRQCGNEVISPENEDDATAEILYNILCRRASSEPFYQRVKSVLADYMAAGRDINTIPVNEFYAPDSIDLTILGELDHQVICIPPKTRFNGNLAVYGASGSKKTRAFCVNMILQCAARKSSLVICDPKSELYEKTSEYLRDQGYTVRVFNLVTPSASDSWNCLAEVGGQELMAQLFCDVIIKNTGGEERDHFWDSAEMNLLKALVLYVSTSYPKEKQNIGEVYQLLTASSEKELNALFDVLPLTHPAKAPYSIFKQASEGVRGGVIIGLGSRLQVFQNKDIRNITSYNEIDLELPGKQPCAYYCITSDQDSTFDFLSSLFLSFVFIRMVRYRVAIPLKEMMLYSGPVPYGAKYKPFMERMNSILATMLTAEIDFIVRGLDNTARSVVASRKAAMLRKRQTFYLDTNEDGVPMIYEGRVVQARVIGVAEKVLRAEVFGVECTIFARDLSAAWFGDAREYYSVGDRVLVRVLTIDRSDINHISITADIRSVSSAANQSNLDKCVLQGKYAGRVTDVRHGVVFIRLNNGVNAVAHTCYDRRMPGKKDDVSFAVTRLDEERGIAVGIITRIIKQNL